MQTGWGRMAAVAAALGVAGCGSAAQLETADASTTTADGPTGTPDGAGAPDAPPGTPDAPPPPDARPPPDAMGSCGGDGDCWYLDTACTFGRCVGGFCQTANRPTGHPCEDGLVCTTGDGCMAGSCVGGPPPVCPGSSDPCVSYVCDELAGGCVPAASPDGTPCDDGLFCTEFDACSGGACAGSPRWCGWMDAACQSGVCDEDLDMCVAQPANEGGPCDDGSACTGNDACASGVCTGDPAAGCPAPPCWTGTCSGSGTYCVYTPLADGTACDDQSSCTSGTTCAAGSCQGGIPVMGGSPCDDHLSCTSGTTCMLGACAGGASTPTFFSEDFSDNLAGWTLDAEWQIGPATASPGGGYGNPDPPFDHSPTSDDGVAGVVIGGNAAAGAVHPYYYLTSPPFNAMTPGPVVLGFWRWLNSDYDPFMHNRVDVWNGATWVNVWTSGGSPGVADAAWTYVSYDVTAHKNAGMRVRFGFDVGNPGVYSVSSWNLDDVRVSSTTCGP